jgi:hypothetical protein
MVIIGFSESFSDSSGHDTQLNVPKKSIPATHFLSVNIFA